jgi:4-alpha-glucanotransferase
MGFKVLQILPINPFCKFSFSPYSGNSAFGFEHSFISVDKLIFDNFIDNQDVEKIINDYNLETLDNYINYQYCFDFKNKIFDISFQSSFKNIKDKLDEFCSQNEWVKNYAYWYCIKEIQDQKPWYEWDDKFKYYENIDFEDIFKFIDEKRFYYYVFLQYVAFKQYMEFKNYANRKGFLIVGDIPIYVSWDSVDVWANRDIFKLDSNGYPLFVAGVPPDYFSETGQLWGNPVYDWEKLKKQNFKWWIDRLLFCFQIYDWVRIDHFRGLVAFWEVKYGSENAINGRWVEAKPYEFFDTLLDYKPVLPIVAEDLGVITPDVDLFRNHYNIPSMKVLQFAFSDPDNPHLPHNYSNNTVAYTGTHDNNTTKGWFRKDNPNKEFIKQYLGKEVNEDNITYELISLLLSSPANLVIIPINDILNLDENYRINTPGTTSGNWIYRDNLLQNFQNIDYFYNLNKKYGRI